MSCTEALKAHQEEGATRPDRDSVEPVKDSIEFQLGYRLGWHHGMDDAVEISEEDETD